jgi:hypothetical protein
VHAVLEDYGDAAINHVWISITRNTTHDLNLRHLLSHICHPPCHPLRLTLMVEAARRAGIEVQEKTHLLEDAKRASEFFALSTTRDLLPISSLGDATYDTDGPMQAKLQAAMTEYVLSLEPGA